MQHTKTIEPINLAGYLFSLIHFLRPDKNMLSCFVSEYAAGNYSWLMTTGFFS